MTERLPTLEEIEALPESEKIELVPLETSSLVNGTLGIGFADNESITLVCDKRIPIHRNDMKSKSQSLQPAEIGALTLMLNEERIIYVGNDNPLVIQRVSRRNSAPIIKVSHTEALDVDHFDNNVHRLKSKLKLGLEV